MTASSTTTPTDDMWMRRALELAEDAVAEQGEVPVGCVFVNDNNVEIASAANETNEAMCATRHAELVAIDGALKHSAARGQPLDWTRCALYVTCEPCIMCASALSQLGIAKCYFGCRNDKFGGCGSILSLHEGNFDIVEGLRARPRPDTSYGGDDYSIDDYSIDDYSIGDYSMDDYSIDDFSNDDYSDDDYSNDYPMDDDDSKDPGPKTPSRRRRERGRAAAGRRTRAVGLELSVAAARSRRYSASRAAAGGSLALSEGGTAERWTRGLGGGPRAGSGGGSLRARPGRGRVGGWNVPKVTTMEELFDANAAFNESVDAWDASTLTGVEEMLDGDAPESARAGLAASPRPRGPAADSRSPPTPQTHPAPRPRRVNDAAHRVTRLRDRRRRRSPPACWDGHGASGTIAAPRATAPPVAAAAGGP
ncbi:dCMP-type deaminase [Aureococcus anophagefferens]|uniref:dCMP-type deaminase n=1 Tax=Aureococcus anophagefferens TaxID=44056 RepID=A0ABR1FMP1_AURAN